MEMVSTPWRCVAPATGATGQRRRKRTDTRTHAKGSRATNGSKRIRHTHVHTSKMHLAVIVQRRLVRTIARQHAVVGSVMIGLIRTTHTPVVCFSTAMAVTVMAVSAQLMWQPSQMATTY